MYLGSFSLIKMVRNWCWNYYNAEKKDPKKGICKFLDSLEVIDVEIEEIEKDIILSSDDEDFEE